MRYIVKKKKTVAVHSNIIIFVFNILHGHADSMYLKKLYLYCELVCDKVKNATYLKYK